MVKFTLTAMSPENGETITDSRLRSERMTHRFRLQVLYFNKIDDADESSAL